MQQGGLGVAIVARRLAAQAVDRPVARRRDDPARRAGRHPVGRPAHDRLGERVLHRVLGDRDVAEDADEDGHGAAVLLAEDTLDVGQCSSKKGRTSIGSVVAPAIRPPPPSASSRSATSMIEMPPRYSLPSMNGPSVAPTSPSLSCITVAVLGACSPPANTHAPASRRSLLTTVRSRMTCSRNSGSGVPPSG